MEPPTMLSKEPADLHFSSHVFRNERWYMINGLIKARDKSVYNGKSGRPNQEIKCPCPFLIFQLFAICVCTR
jgi:hypothetical protein